MREQDYARIRYRGKSNTEKGRNYCVDMGKNINAHRYRMEIIKIHAWLRKKINTDLYNIFFLYFIIFMNIFEIESTIYIDLIYL